MSQVLVMGSLAYDYIMRFPDIFANHILPERLQILNVCFTAHQLSKNFGGTAGNIGYSLRLLNEQPIIFATAGKDFADYQHWLEENHIITSEIYTYKDEWTASAHIITDKKENQITAFYGGAMFKNNISLLPLLPKYQMAFAIIAADGKDGMLSHAKELKEAKVPYIYDPGHSIPSFQKQELLDLTQGAFIIIMNEYEIHLFLEKTQMSQAELLRVVKYLIVTCGAKGSTIYAEGEQLEIPSVPARKVVDPTGAGDAYRGGLLKGLLHKQPIDICAKLGSTVAAYVVEEFGTQSYTFTIEDFKRRYRDAYGDFSSLDQIFRE